MATNIEKLYELAGIKATHNCDSCVYLKLDVMRDYCRKYENGKSDCNDKSFPPFTEEKQLKLIRWIQINKYKQYLHFVDVVSSYFRGLKFETEEEEKKFIDSEYPQKLAKFVCELWDDLTPEQREEIKRILE